MARKEQITITLNADLTRQLRALAKRRGMSLSSVIESVLLSSDALAGKTDIQRVIELLENIKTEFQSTPSGLAEADEQSVADDTT